MKKLKFSWSDLTFAQKCKFISKCIAKDKFTKNQLSRFMFRRFHVMEPEWMKCVNALDDNCDCVGVKLDK